jgi:hypothetical protein
MKSSRKQGLRWKKLDLHVHTPASVDYTGPPCTPDEFVKQALSSGVDGIAITDHNTAAWLDPIREAAKATNLAVFPGVEISATGGAGGIHIIALFDRQVSSKTIEALLAKANIPPDMYGRQEALSPKSPVEVIELICEMGGIAILAHADSSKGVLHDMRGQGRIQVMNSASLTAVELTNVSKTSPLLNGDDPDYRRKLPFYRASDSPNPSAAGHSVEGIGSRFSWFKVDGLSLEALAQCFNDPDVRILADELCPTHPDTMYPRINSVTVSQGFLEGTPFVFHEGLNSIIGGKGVGKSLLVELLRFALDQPSPIVDLAKDMMGKLHAQLGIGGVVTVVVQLEPDQTITVERTFDSRSNPIRTYSSSADDALSGHIAQLFPIVAYSQTETLEIAKNTSAQLQLIDSFIDTAGVTRRTGELRAKLTRSDAVFATAMRVQEELVSRERDLVTAKEKLARLDRALASKHHEELQQLEPRTQSLKAFVQHVADLQEVVLQAEVELQSCLVPEIASDLAADADLTELQSQATALLQDAVAVFTALHQRIDQYSGSLEVVDLAWKEVVRRKTEEYRLWAQQEGGDRPQLLSLQQNAVEDRDAAEQAVATAKATAQGLPELHRIRTELLDTLALETHNLFELRKAKFEEISIASRDRLRLTLRRNGIRSQYQQALSALKKGSKLPESSISAITARVEPRALVDYVLTDNSPGLATAAGLTSTEADRLVRHLRDLEDVSELLALQHQPLLEDEPSIQFKKDDGNYYDLGSLSVGQKCTALLIIALSEGNRPVIIDQPEDALDIPSVYQDVTIQLRNRKSSRQFILTTHNPTVAVASDSDQFHVLRASATSAEFSAQGAIDKPAVRAEVLQHLEGGDVPFRLKTLKYNPVRS